MSESISALYSDLILRHNREPFGFGVLADANHRGVAENRSCGDHVVLEFAVDGDDRITAAQFHGEGCAICTAAASILCQSLLQRDKLAALVFLTDAEALIQTGEPPARDIGALLAFAELKHVPARRRCALLPVSAARVALGSN